MQFIIIVFKFILMKKGKRILQWHQHRTLFHYHQSHYNTSGLVLSISAAHGQAHQLSSQTHHHVRPINEVKISSRLQGSVSIYQDQLVTASRGSSQKESVALVRPLSEIII